ncbi:MAG: rRNA adenine N-6-methyltransferase family protein [Polaribacter sp.]|nr:rRNA adenine N-6-methyltransferase family protein [Polaribacter sp.]MDG1810613.1 rRNA adenine N-6-methyltransferase family protein [Polaribacter sp.]MDG1992914.1 rRNA adenine N-6-methyltransferase family protein [Polaribacter sp.]
MGHKIDFFKVAVRSLKTSGTVAPSSRFLAQKMLKKINFQTCKVLVELGPGNGIITKQILKKIQPNSHLVCFEVNDAFYKDLQKINHPQLTVLKVSAEDIQTEMQKLGFTNACHIVSSLPLTIIPNSISNTILENALKTLQNNGTFIQYQYSLTYYKKLKTVFRENISLDFELLNFPPAFVYRCKKEH